jgi:hypothetical protein
MPDSRNTENQYIHKVAADNVSTVAGPTTSSILVPSDQPQEGQTPPANVNGNGSQPPSDEIGIPAREVKQPSIPKSASAERIDQPSILRSTGPRTEPGKKRSSQNALKAGIFSRVILLKGESRSEYQSLLEGLWKSLQPEGKLEQVLVEKLATTLWRHQRLLIAEGAEIRKNSEFPEVSSQQQVGIELQMALENVGLISGVYDPDVLERCLELLVELARGIEANGFDEEQDGLRLRTIYGDPDRYHFRETLQDKYSIRLNTARVDEEERAREGYATPEQCKQNVLLVIGDEIDSLKQDQKKRESIKSERTKLEILRQTVPDSRGMDRFLRYETHLSREIDRILNRLERVQRMRKGQPPPPQLEVKIS